MGRGAALLVGVGALLVAGHVGYVAGAHGTAWHGGFGRHAGPAPIASGVPGPGTSARQTPPPGYSPFGSRDLKLGVDEVRAESERFIARLGNARLKLGEVKEVDGDAITADIVTKDGAALVERLRVDRHTGYTRSQEN
ncbi:MAG: hypothetical protein U1E56_01135 [Bauldia sp.]